jgi:putative PIN family toxin of toxin-antitoxin system
MTETKPKAVVDSNIFFSGTVFKRGIRFEVLSAWRASAFDLVFSAARRLELADVFSRRSLVERYQITGAEIELLVAGLDAVELVQPVATRPLPVRDPKDGPILAAALGGAADYLVTGDNDLLVLRGDPRLGSLPIVTAAEFLAVLRPREDNPDAPT